jgi:L-ascorbate metabolism protein UlaG (beta-lactamase superfamily)
MLLFGVIVLIIVVFIYFFMHGAQFGALPYGESLQKIRASPHYRDGQFQNLSNTPQLTEGASFFGILKKFFFDKSEQRVPPASLPSVKTDLLNLNKDKNILVWFGHSSYFMQIDGRTFLVDPVFSGNASPLRFTTKSFKGSDIYTVPDFPAIDYLIISHDHWDHLDYRTVLQLKSKVNMVITGLGTAAHLISWGYDKKRIDERDWNEQIMLEDGFIINTTPARHFSGRGFKRNRSIWLSFVLTTPSKKIFIGGDSGYDYHFADIGNRFGPFDLAILEDGQYNRYWKYIHMNPEETVQAALDIKAHKLLPVHWGKFSLSIHSWDEPIIRIKKEAERRNLKLLHPMIGEIIDLDTDQVFSSWWERIS